MECLAGRTAPMAMLTISGKDWRRITAADLPDRVDFGLGSA